MTQAGRDPRRRFERMKTMLDALVLLDRGQAQVRCTIRNMSEGGALVVLEQSTMVPEFFQLSIPSRRQVHNCRIAWRSGLQIGAQFITQSTFGTAAAMQDQPRAPSRGLMNSIFSMTKGEQICVALALIFALATAIIAWS